MRIDTSKWIWSVQGYASNKHHAYPAVKLGDLLVHTTHSSDGSKDTTVEAWKLRMKRGDVAYVVVTDLRTNKQETLYPPTKNRKRERL